MKTLIRTVATATLLSAWAVASNAGAPGPETGAFYDLTPLAPITETHAALESKTVAIATLPQNAKIAVARLDGGRLIPTPHGEAFDWTLLAKRTGVQIEPLSAGRALDYVPEIPFGGYDSDNKIDEIRLAAVGEGYSHVILYGVGPDARWSSFGGKALTETGLIVGDDCDSWKSAKAKALLVDAYNGQVLGAATADNIEFHIGELADEVEALITRVAENSTT
jgi:hypothetical protein